MQAEWFAERLRELRASVGLTQQQLADASKLSIRIITYYESGNREPSWSNVVALASALGVSCEAFLQEPAAASTEPAKRGRPRKGEPEPAVAESKPAKRGRPRKPKAEAGTDDEKPARKRKGK